MKIEFSKRALADLDRLITYYQTVAGPKIAANAEAHIRRVLMRLVDAPESAVELPERAGIRAAVVRGYPHIIFYRVRGDRIQIAHIRHTSRRPWSGR